MLTSPSMKAAVHLGDGVCRVADMPLPQGEGLLVAVDHCGICGTDLTIHKGQHPRAKPGLVLGHEFVGRVMEEGETFSVGDRVVCFPLIECGTCEPCKIGHAHVCRNLKLYGIDAPGGMAEVVRIPEANLFAIDERVPGTVAAQVEPLAVCIHAASRAGEIAGQDVLIIGAGPIGATLALVLQELGVRTTTLIEPNPDRASQVEQLGLSVFAPSVEAVEGRLQDIGREKFDVVFECAGVEQAFDLAMRSVRNHGTVVVVSIHKAPSQIALQDICFREISVVGARVYTRDDFRQAIELAEALTPKLQAMVSSVAKLNEAPESLARLAKGAPDLKIVLRIEQGGT